MRPNLNHFVSQSKREQGTSVRRILGTVKELLTGRGGLFPALDLVYEGKRVSRLSC